MAMTTAYRASTPAGIEVRRVVDGDVDDLQALIDAHWPLLLTEMQIAHARGSLWTARAGGRLVGFSAHSTMRTGWIGPMGTAPDHRGRGVGAALLSAACEDLQQRGIPAADIAWVGPVEYFAAKGARVTRTFERYVRELR
jgi:GNAT superfamily N-acetyltransferase